MCFHRVDVFVGINDFFCSHRVDQSIQTETTRFEVKQFLVRIIIQYEARIFCVFFKHTASQINLLDATEHLFGYLHNLSENAHLRIQRREETRLLFI